MHRILKVCNGLRFSKIGTKFFIGMLISISIVFFVSFINFRIHSIINDWEYKVYRGVTINNLDVGGMSETSLREFLYGKFSNELEEFDVEFALNGESVKISSNVLGLNYDYEDAIEQAINFSKDLNYFSKISQILNPTRSLNISLKEEFNIKNEDSLYEILSENFNVEPINAIAYISDGQVVVNEGSSGVEIDKESLIKMINDTDPSLLDGGKIEVPTRTLNSKVSAADLSRINGQLSSYSTSFKSSSNERAANVELSSKAINGTILMPGETFSFNKVVGPRTKERGYKDATIIVGNVYESGLGGGICQTSSTLHQAVVRAGIIPTQRRNHTLATSYMPLGFDAAVAWGSLDYVFKNTYDFPILIDVSTSGRNLTVSIYGDVTAVDKLYSVEAETYETIPFTTKNVNDSSLASGKQIVDKNGVNGKKVRVYIVIKDKYTGKVIERKFVWDDYYVPQQKVVRIGTK